MKVQFRHQVVVNEQHMEARVLTVDWPPYLPLPSIGDNVDCLAGADPLGMGFQVDARTLLLEAQPVFAMFTQFHDAEPGEATWEALDRILEDVPGEWVKED